MFSGVSRAVQGVFDKMAEKIGRKYSIMEYVGAPDAEIVVVVMGSSSLTAEAVIEKMDGKVGFINVRLWKPFDMDFFVKLLPPTCKGIAVLDRARDFVSAGELLFKEVLTTVFKKGLIG